MTSRPLSGTKVTVFDHVAKLLVTVFGLSALTLTTPAFGQGLVILQNTVTTPFQTNVPSVSFGGTSGNTPGGTNSVGTFDYELLTAPSTVKTVDLSLQDLLTSPWSDTGIFGQNIGLPGRMRSTNEVANNWPAGVEQSFIVIGWSANIGSFAQLKADLSGATLEPINGSYAWEGGGMYAGGPVWVGATTVQAITAGGAFGFPPAQVFGTGPSAQGTPIMTPTELYTVWIPEPSASGLLALGAASFLIFRIRK